MRLSKKSVYALRVLRHLTDRYGKEPLSAAWLAQEEEIPRKYLEQILLILKSGNALAAAPHLDHGGHLAIHAEAHEVGALAGYDLAPVIKSNLMRRITGHRCDRLRQGDVLASSRQQRGAVEQRERYVVAGQEIQQAQGRQVPR